MNQLAQAVGASSSPQFKCPGAHDRRWPQECVELLIELWRDGVYASQIADLVRPLRFKITGLHTSRNAIIAKAHRTLVYKDHEWLALNEAHPRNTLERKNTEKTRLATNTGPRKRRAPAASSWRKKTRRVHLAAHQLPALSEAPTDVIKVLDLKESMCHWPIGDPMEEGFHFCGRRKSFGVPYCEHHAAIAYNPYVRRAA